MKRFVKGDRGAVSVFLIVLIAPIFFFNAVLIDFARIKLAERESELALKTALDSVMSSFDVKVQDYGLYGMDAGQTSMDTIMQTVIKNNLPQGLDNNSYTYTDTMLESISAAASHTLKEHPVLKQQILEEMKYRAPLELTMGIIDAFTSSKADAMMHGSVAFAREAKKLEKKIEKRQDHIDKLLTAAKSIKEGLDSNLPTYRANLNRIGNETETSLNDKIRNLNQQIGDIERQISFVAMQTSNNPATSASLARQIVALQNEASAKRAEREKWEELLRLLIETKKSMDKLRGKIQKDKESFDKNVQPAMKLDHEIKVQKEQLVSKLRQMNQRDTTDFASVKVYGDAFFNQLKQHVLKVSSAYDRFHSSFNLSSLGQLDSTQLSEMGSLLQKLNEMTSEHQGNQAERKKLEKKAKQNLAEASLRIAKRVTVACVNSGAKYDKVQSYYSAYLPTTDSLVQYPQEIPQDPEEMQEHSAGFSDLLMGSIGDKLLDFRDKLYVDEYGLSKFNHFAYVKKGIVEPNLSKHKLKNQEAEYILYGFNSCEGNLSAASAELFSARFLLRMTEFILDPTNAPLKATPWTFVLGAISYAALHAATDIVELLSPENHPDGVEIMNRPGFDKIMLTYKDYLRLFMLIHGNETKMMARMQALIQLNTDKDLSKLATYTEGNSQTSVKLWFLPGIIRVLNLTGIASGEVQKNRFHITKSAASSY
ncbi:hypothetical protein MH117_17200 [Paenibacillus sp. ACRRX]|uniref:hypothetical protein n=1 Tax=Paenibacillus sp. ACRRX TaxID=2918206 RepID=UPI001EF45F67|nr:hypothetical protein [Paenibacillus sp. ACRRX]MCG7409156.1 hypothetical protein [Paenibacillus sp. ACRRX]